MQRDIQLFTIYAVPQPIAVTLTATPPSSHYTGLNLTLSCTVLGSDQVPGTTASIQVTNPQNMLITSDSRITVGSVVEVPGGSIFQQRVQFRPLSALVDIGSFTCSAAFVPVQTNNFVLNSTPVMAAPTTLTVMGLPLSIRFTT